MCTNPSSKTRFTRTFYTRHIRPVKDWKVIKETNIHFRKLHRPESKKVIVNSEI